MSDPNILKGIILAGGRATRLYPITKGVCKQLLPVYDKPMIYYPLSTLMLAGIKEILIISDTDNLPGFKRLLNNGRHLGLDISYAIQDNPAGLPEAFIIGEDFIKDKRVTLILGDNIFFGHGLPDLLRTAIGRNQPTIFPYHVKDPQRHGIVEFDDHGRIVSLEEKPEAPKSNWAVTGLYIYDNDVVRIAKSLQPSKRGELEIMDINKEYHRQNRLRAVYLWRGFAWLDTGTYDSLIDASTFVKTIEERQGLKVGCVEEIAYRMDFINQGQLLDLADAITTSYGDYLRGIAREKAITFD